jgi:hypothetical protein
MFIFFLVRFEAAACFLRPSASQEQATDHSQDNETEPGAIQHPTEGWIVKMARRCAFNQMIFEAT